MKTSIRGALLAIAVVVAAGCGSPDFVTPVSATAGYHITAKIDGVPWTSINGAERLGGFFTAPATYGIVGNSSPTGTTVYGISVTLIGVTGVGVYAIGSGSKALVTLSMPNGLWGSTGAGAEGSMTITTISSSRVAGTFHATLVPNSTSAAVGNRSVTDGDFDVSVKPLGLLSVADRRP